MKKLILVFLLITSFAYSQGGPNVDKITFRGQVTTSIRNQITVDPGTTMLIHNITTNKLEIAGDDEVWTTVGDGLQDGVNIVNALTVSSGVNNNYLEISGSGGGFSDNLVKLAGGNGNGNGVILLLQEGSATLSGLSFTDISNAGNTSLVTKEFVVNNLNGREPYLQIPTSDGQILSSTVSGVRSWIDPPSGTGGGSDNLGNHTATQELNLNGFGINLPGTLRAGTTTLTINPNSSINVNASFVVPNLPYNSTTWNGLTSVPTRNDVRDALESLNVSGLSTENQLRIDNMNVTRRIVVTGDNVVSTLSNARTIDAPFEGKVKTVIEGNFNFLLNNAEPLNTLFVIEAGELASDSVQIKRNNSSIKFLIDGRKTGLVSDDYDGVSLKALKTSLVERISNNLYKISCYCWPLSGDIFPDLAGSFSFPNSTNVTWTNNTSASATLVSGSPNEVRITSLNNSGSDFATQDIITTPVSGDVVVLTGQLWYESGSFAHAQIRQVGGTSSKFEADTSISNQWQDFTETITIGSTGNVVFDAPTDGAMKLRKLKVVNQ